MNHGRSQTEEQLPAVSCQHYKLFAKQLRLSHHLVKQVHQDERVFELVAPAYRSQLALRLLGRKMRFQLSETKLK